MMLDDKFTIWSNRNLDYAKWRPDLELEYPNKNEDERYKMMYELNDDYLNDERMNLNIQLSQPILVIADIGRWNGRFSGYKEIDSGKISDCLYSECDYCEWYIDKSGDLRCTASHHDGTNYYLYRVYKDDVSDDDIDKLKDELCDGIAANAGISKITNRLGDEIASLYGFDITHKKAKAYER